jgi:alpha-beta hydrolase superfamily lysophospholipase
MKRQMFSGFARRKGFVLLFLVVVLGMAATLFIPWNLNALASHTHPVKSYEEAVQRIDTLQADHVSAMNPDCLTEFMTHGQKVQNVIVLVHGYTSCPAQFKELGEQFYDLGYNVLIVPLPHHGLADRMTDEQSQLTADELAIYADEVVDIAQGLGDRVTVMGFSCGGIVTAWVAQNRSDVDTAVIISPAFGFKQIPTPVTAPVMNMVLVLPNSFEWWDPTLQAEAGPIHAYPRYSKHTLAQIMRLGFAVQIKARQGAPAANRLIVVTNANDTSVNNLLTSQVVTVWQEHGANITTYEFPVRLGLGHDLIDPVQPDQRIDIVYPQLIELITK